jgi:hypothetical protein
VFISANMDKDKGEESVGREAITGRIWIIIESVEKEHLLLWKSIICPLVLLGKAGRT